MNLVAHTVTSRCGARQDHTTDTFVPYNIVGLAQQGSNHAYEAGPVIAQPLRSNVRNNSDPAMEAKQHVYSPMGVRRLTPVECCRLQAFPDDHLDIDPPLSDSAKYRMLGNAVCTNVAEWIGKQLMRALTHD